MDQVCITCPLFTALQTSSEAMIHSYFTTVGPYLLNVLQGVALLWGVWQVFLYITASPRAMNMDDAAIQLISFLVAGAVLQGNQMWWDFFKLIFDLAVSAGTLAFKAVNNTMPVEDFTGLLRAAESALKTQVTQALIDMGEEAVWWQVLKAIAILGLLLVYAALAWKMVKALISAYLRFFAIGLLSPFVVALAAFPVTRSTLSAAIKSLVSSGFQLILAAGLTGLVISFFAAMAGNIPTPDLSEGKPAAWLLGTEYLGFLLTGLILFLTYDEIMHTGAQVLQLVETQSGLSAGRMFSAIRPGGGGKK